MDRLKKPSMRKINSWNWKMTCRHAKFSRDKLSTFFHIQKAIFSRVQHYRINAIKKDIAHAI